MSYRIFEYDKWLLPYQKDIELRMDNYERKLCELVGDGTLFISDFSAPLFVNSDVSAIAVSDPLFSAGEADFAFVEDRAVSEYKDKINKLVIYRWNRKYPFDMAFDLDPEKEGMQLLESIDFVGYSHEKITREIWRR